MSTWINLSWITVMFYFNGNKPQSPFYSVVADVRVRSLEVWDFTQLIRGCTGFDTGYLFHTSEEPS